MQLRVMVNSATFLTTLLFALGNLLGQNLGNHDQDWTNYYGVFLGVSLSAIVKACLQHLLVCRHSTRSISSALVGMLFSYLAADDTSAVQTSISMSSGALVLYAIFVIWLQSTVNKAFVGGSIAPLGWTRFTRTPARLPK